jgi:hypothetical protein
VIQSAYGSSNYIISRRRSKQKLFLQLNRDLLVGRDIEQMSGDIGRWMGAVSDVDNAEKQAKNPPLFGKLV